MKGMETPARENISDLFLLQLSMCVYVCESDI